MPRAGHIILPYQFQFCSYTPVSVLTVDTAVRQFAKSDFCLSDLGVAFGHSANTMNDKIEFMLTRKNPLATDEEGLGAEGLDSASTVATGLSFWLIMEEALHLMY